MASLGTTILLVCVAMHASLCVAAKVPSNDAVYKNNVKDDYDGIKEATTIGINNDTIYYHATTEIIIADCEQEIIIDDCEQLYELGCKSARRIITRGDEIAKCVSDISNILHSDDGVLIVLGANKLTVLHIIEQSKLFYNKFHDLPKHIVTFRSYVYNEELDVKVFVTSKVIGEQLLKLLKETKYSEAVELSKFIHSQIYDTSVRIKIITDVVRTLLKNGNYIVMNYAHNLKINGAMDIITDCFPPGIKAIFSGNGCEILNRDKTAALRLSMEIDKHEDRWLYSDCDYESARDKYWLFNPYWDIDLDIVVFNISNIEYDMRLKLDFNTNSHYGSERGAYGDKKRQDVRYKWRLIPTGFQEYSNELLFCVVEEFHASYLIPNDGIFNKKDVRGIFAPPCNPKLGWHIQT